MDQYLSEVIIVIITGIFGLITVYVNKKQDKVVQKIDKQTMFMEKEKAIKQRLSAKEKEHELIIHEIMMLILDTNLAILKHTQNNGNIIVDESVYAKSVELKKKFDQISDDIEDINKEYQVVLEMASAIQEEMRKSTEGKGN